MNRPTYIVVRNGEHLKETKSLHAAEAEKVRREEWERTEAPKWGLTPAAISIRTRK